MIEKEKRFTSDLFAYQGNFQVRNIILAYKNSFFFFAEKRIESLCFRYYTLIMIITEIFLFIGKSLHWMKNIGLISS